ncbi:hypothetical protein [Streptomyces lavendulocolor]|uniref:hypothetical protein n=1 Tax=Streptomyces lavendulocolor TaxID=67316 RepID=UPI003C2C596F
MAAIAGADIARLPFLQDALDKDSRLLAGPDGWEQYTGVSSISLPATASTPAWRLAPPGVDEVRFRSAAVDVVGAYDPHSLPLALTQLDACHRGRR